MYGTIALFALVGNWLNFPSSNKMFAGKTSALDPNHVIVPLSNKPITYLPWIKVLENALKCGITVNLHHLFFRVQLHFTIEPGDFHR